MNHFLSEVHDEDSLSFIYSSVYTLWCGLQLVIIRFALVLQVIGII